MEHAWNSSPKSQLWNATYYLLCSVGGRRSKFAPLMVRAANAGEWR